MSRVQPAHGKLREMGVSIAIDDFGTGYSSLSYLQNLPVNTLKIDQSFVRQIAEGVDTPPLIQAVVALGHGLGMKVTAEGVETLRQLRVLQGVTATRYRVISWDGPCRRRRRVGSHPMRCLRAMACWRSMPRPATRLCRPSVSDGAPLPLPESSKPLPVRLLPLPVIA